MSALPQPGPKKNIKLPDASRSRSSRAGLTFPVGRVHRALKKGRYAQRVGTGCPVYLAAAVEYIVAEMLDIAGQEAIANKKQRITPRHISVAVQQDNEMKTLLRDVIIASSGGGINIHPDLIKKTKESLKKEGKTK
uniref:Histone H2A n=1 Tax=Steinernema glaseri TaxID=37863 RepID=A0A1I7Z1U2_9BILA